MNAVCARKVGDPEVYTHLLASNIPPRNTTLCDPLLLLYAVDKVQVQNPHNNHIASLIMIKYSFYHKLEKHMEAYGHVSLKNLKTPENYF